jgi:hypothetical protein
MLDPKEAPLLETKIFLSVGNTDQPASDINPHRPRISGKIEGAIAFGGRYCLHNVVM